MRFNYLQCIFTYFSNFFRGMNAFSITLLAFLAVSAFSQAQKERVLVLIDDAKIEQTHSVFLNGLKQRFEVVVKKADDSTLALIKYGEFLYQHVVILAPSVEGMHIACSFYFSLFRLWWIFECRRVDQVC